MDFVGSAHYCQCCIHTSGHFEHEFSAFDFRRARGSGSSQAVAGCRKDNEEAEETAGFSPIVHASAFSEFWRSARKMNRTLSFHLSFFFFSVAQLYLFFTKTIRGLAKVSDFLYEL